MREAQPIAHAHGCQTIFPRKSQLQNSEVQNVSCEQKQQQKRSTHTSFASPEAKVLVDDTDGITYSFQYKCQSMDKLEEYYADHAPALQRDHAKKYKDKFVAFRTLLEVI